MRARGCILTTLMAVAGQAAFGLAAAQTSGTDGFTPPVPVTSHELTVTDFPRESALGRDEGIVGLRFRVTEEGNVSECSVESTSGYPRLDDAACTAASRWKYTPATQGGMATSAIQHADLLFWIPGAELPLPIPDGNGVGDPSLDLPDSFKPASQSPAYSPRTGFSRAEAINSHALVADDYPWVSIRRGEQDSIEVLYSIAETGDVSGCVVLSATGFPLLDESACTVVARWKFKPATQEGKATSSLARANIVFRLR